MTSAWHDTNGNLLVNEVWYTVQGEGPFAGRPAVFIRLSKCNLRCYFCDTEFESGRERTVRDLHRQVGLLTDRNGCRLVVITGGEPFLQNVAPLVYILNQAGFEVQFETAGTVWHEDFNKLALMKLNTIVVSPKTALVVPGIVPHVSAYKYIVSVTSDIDPADGIPITNTQSPTGRERKLFRPSYDQMQPLRQMTPIYLQPMDEGDAGRNMDNLARVTALCMQYGHRLSVQVHKIAGVP